MAVSEAAFFKLTIQKSELDQSVQFCNKSGQAITIDSQKYQLCSDESTELTYTYSVNECQVQDAGEYHFTVSNKFGKVSCQATLLVQAPPMLISPLADVECVEGTSLELATQLSACYPIPHFEWFTVDADSVETRLEQSERVQLNVTGCDYKLAVLNANQSDETTYLFKASNDLGSVDSKCQAFVFGTTYYYFYRYHYSILRYYCFILGVVFFPSNIHY